MKNTPRFLAKTDKVVKTAQNSIKIIIIIIASLADNHVSTEMSAGASGASNLSAFPANSQQHPTSNVMFV